MRTLNLGILAHVDAGKTSLTERLLYAAGVIDEIGSVDDGSTQTDSLALERQRGITIKSAVVSFVIDDVTVNLIDTPGHPDFIAEVERVLSVLDGAVLVISAVEGVQAQTRVLMRTLQRLRIPTLIFVNKIDRGGARDRARAAEHRRAADAGDRRDGIGVRPGHARAPVSRRTARPTPRSRPGWPICSPSTTTRCWPRTSTTRRRSRTASSARELAAQTRRALVHPVFFGSAITGAGVDCADRRHRGAAARRRGRRGRPGLGHRLQGRARARPGRRSPIVRMFSGQIACGPCETGCGSAGTGDGRRSPRSASSTRRLGRAARVGRRRADRQALGARRRPDRRHDRRRREPRRARHSLRPADAGDGRRCPPPRRQGCAARRARPARRAGPADQPAAGRRAPGHAASRSTARCRRRSSRRRWPTTSASTSSSARRRRSASSGRSAPARPSRSSATAPNPFLATVGLRVEPAGRLRRAVPAGGRARLDAVRVLQGGRGDRAPRRCGRASTAGRSPTAWSP